MLDAYQTTSVLVVAPIQTAFDAGRGLSVIVNMRADELEFARRIASGSSQETARWFRRYSIRVARRIPASSFRPAPRVDSAHLVIRRR